MSTSLLHLHVSRGKRSIVLDLTTDGGRATFLDLVASAGAVVEAMRPGMPWAPAGTLAADQLPFPVRVVGAPRAHWARRHPRHSRHELEARKCQDCSRARSRSRSARAA
jgi:hypothetical protein